MAHINVQPPGVMPLNGTGRKPVFRVTGGDTWSVSFNLYDPTDPSVPATPENTLARAVLTETQFDTPLWEGEWNAGIVPDARRPGLARLAVPVAVTRRLRRGSYLFSVRVSDLLKTAFATEAEGSFLVEYAPTSDQHSIPYKEPDATRGGISGKESDRTKVYKEEFASVGELENATLRQTSEKVNEILGKLKVSGFRTPALALLLSLSAALPSFGALGPSTPFGDVPPDTTLRAVVEASGSSGTTPSQVTNIAENVFAAMTPKKVALSNVTNAYGNAVSATDVGALPAEKKTGYSTYYAINNDLKYSAKVNGHTFATTITPDYYNIVGNFDYPYAQAYSASFTGNGIDHVPSALAGTTYHLSFPATNGTLAVGTIPTKTSELTNDSGYLTSETDPSFTLWNTGNNTVIVAGKNASATAGNATAYGAESKVGSGSVAVGYKAQATKGKSVSVGYNATSKGTFGSTALGYAASAGNSSGLSTAIGVSTKADGDYATSIGASASAKSSHSIAIGYYASATNIRSVVIGNDAVSHGDRTLNFSADDLEKVYLGDSSLQSLVNGVLSGDNPHFSNAVVSVGSNEYMPMYSSSDHGNSAKLYWINDNVLGGQRFTFQAPGEITISSWGNLKARTNPVADLPTYLNSLNWLTTTNRTLSSYKITDAYTKAETDELISHTNANFSNEVLAVGLNVDTNLVAALNAMSNGSISTETGATTIGTLLLALAASVAWLKKNKQNNLSVSVNSSTGVATITY